MKLKISCETRFKGGITDVNIEQQKYAPCYPSKNSKKEKEELCYPMTTPSLKKKQFPTLDNYYTMTIPKKMRLVIQITAKRNTFQSHDNYHTMTTLSNKKIHIFIQITTKRSTF
jgi:hypothetical protein